MVVVVAVISFWAFKQVRESGEQSKKTLALLTNAEDLLSTLNRSY
jgi:CHASE3 domain sensor protein